MSETAWPGEFVGSDTFGSSDVVHVVHVVQQACMQASHLLYAWRTLAMLPLSPFAIQQLVEGKEVFVGMGSCRLSEGRLSWKTICSL